MNFLKTTLVGGMVFMVPIIVLVMILGKAYSIMAKVAAPMAEWIPIDAVGGVALANLLAIAAIVVICFGAGIVAKSTAVSKWVGSLESNVLTSIPGYAFIKGMTGGVTGGEGDQQLTPVLARFDDGWQIAFQVEVLPDGRSVLYMPGAPDPWSGSLMIMNGDRVEPLDISMSGTARNIRGLGRGSGEFLCPKL